MISIGDYRIIWFVPYQLRDDGAYCGSSVYHKKDVPDFGVGIISTEPLFVGTEDECRAYIERIKV